MLFGLLSLMVLWPIKPISAETLQQSVMQALAAHPSVEAALANKEIAIQDKKEARSDLFPIISAGTSVGRIHSNNSTSRGLTITRGAAYSGLWEANATVTQPLYDGMQTKNRIDAANARMQSADYNVLDVRENLALRATQAHIAVLQAEATLVRTKSYYEAIENYLIKIQLMVDEGVADESEVSQARNISLMLQSTLTDYEGQLKTALANYSEIVGQAPSSTLTKPINQKLMSDIQSAIAYAKSNHPLLKSNQKEMEAIEFEIKAEKGALYPGLDAEVSGIKRDQKEEIGGELKDTRALLKLTWDFETGGALEARGKRLRAQYSEITAENKEKLRSIEGDIYRAYTELETAQKQVDLIKEREAVTSNLFEAYKAQFEGARVRLLQLMQAENQFFNSQLESITAEYRYLMAQYTVLASIGQLQETVIVGGQKRPIKKIRSVQPVEKIETIIKYDEDPIINPQIKYVEPKNKVELEVVKEQEVEEQEFIEIMTVEPVVPEHRPLQKVSSGERIYITTK